MCVCVCFKQQRYHSSIYPPIYKWKLTVENDSSVAFFFSQLNWNTKAMNKKKHEELNLSHLVTHMRIVNNRQKGKRISASGKSCSFSVTDRTWVCISLFKRKKKLCMICTKKEKWYLTAIFIQSNFVLKNQFIGIYISGLMCFVYTNFALYNPMSHYTLQQISFMWKNFYYYVFFYWKIDFKSRLNASCIAFNIFFRHRLIFNIKKQIQFVRFLVHFH